MAEANTYLGIDYGLSKVGLSLADDETRMAFSYGMILNDKNFIQNLLAIIKKEKVKKIIIGIPYYLKKNIIYEGEKLKKTLELLIDVRIEFQDEMFTTKIAQSNLKAQGLKKLNQIDDQESARIILQSWLDKK